MNRKLVTLGAMAAVLVVALGGYVGLTRWNAAQAAAESAAAADIEVATLPADEISAIDSQVEGYALSLVKQDGTWQLADDAAFPLGQSYVDTMLKTVAPLAGQGPLQDAGDLSEYGLGDGCDTIVLTGADGSTATLLLGDTNSLTGRVYATVEGSGAVYTVSSSVRSPFAHTRDELLQMEEIPYMDDILSLTVENAAGTWTYDFAAAEAAQEAGSTSSSGAASSDASDSSGGSTAGSSAAPDSTSESTLGASSDAQSQEDPQADLASQRADALALLAWQSCAAWDGDLAAYGLDSPAATVTAVYSDSAAGSEDSSAAADAQATFTMLIGAACPDGGYYACLSGSGLVYTIDADTAELFLS